MPTTKHAMIAAEEVQKFLADKGYTKPVAENEFRAIRRVQIIAELGFPVTHERIETELKITRQRIAALSSG